MTAQPEPSPHPSPGPTAREPLADAFEVADRLAVHGSDCVCPRCAGQLPFLLRDLARALDRGDGAPA